MKLGNHSRQSYILHKMAMHYIVFQSCCKAKENSAHTLTWLYSIYLTDLHLGARTTVVEYPRRTPGMFVNSSVSFSDNGTIVLSSSSSAGAPSNCGKATLWGMVPTVSLICGMSRSNPAPSGSACKSVWHADQSH